MNFAILKNPLNKTAKEHNFELKWKKDFDYLATYNIRFYEFDSINRTPGEELYFENLIVEPTKNKTYKLKINIDVLKLNYLKRYLHWVEIINTKYNEEIVQCLK
jgi:hypothetical protein